MTSHLLNVSAIWDEEAEVWVAASNDIKGLAAESPTYEGLQKKVKSAVAELVKYNLIVAEPSEFLIHFVSHRTFSVTNPHH